MWEGGVARLQRANKLGMVRKGSAGASAPHHGLATRFAALSKHTVFGPAAKQARGRLKNLTLDIASPTHTVDSPHARLSDSR